MQKEKKYRIRTKLGKGARFALNSDPHALKTVIQLLYWPGFSTSIPSLSREEPAFGRKGRGVNFPFRRLRLLQGKFTPLPSLPQGDSSLLREGMQDASSSPTQHFITFRALAPELRAHSSFSEFRPNKITFLN